MECKKIWLPLVSLLCCAVAPAHAHWVQDGIAASTYANGQGAPALVSNGVRGAIIVWSENSISTGSFDIYAQRVDEYGDVLWSMDGVSICTEALSQLSPEIISDGEGGAIVVWSDDRSGTTNDLYAQRIDASSAVLWSYSCGLFPPPPQSAHRIGFSPSFECHDDFLA